MTEGGVHNEQVGMGGEEESFAALFQASEFGSGERVKVGDKISGRVIDVGEENVFVDTGAKIDGVIARNELLDESGQLTVKVGDTVDLYVTAIGDNAITLSRALSGQGGIDLLQEAYENRVPVEGLVKAVNKGGFDVIVFHRRVFCPMSQMDLRMVENAEEYVGQKLTFQITKFENKGRNVVVSRRALLEAQRRETLDSFVEQVTPGMVLEGKIVRVMPFGAFVELATGVEGLAHVSELGFTRVEDASQLVKPGDVVAVKVLNMENVKDKRGRDQLKISLSMKQAMADPWENVPARYQAGDVVTGTVVRLAPFGAFVSLEPGVDGLVHVSELTYLRRVNKPEDVVSVGQEIQVKIKEIDPEKRRISLSARDAEGDPWADVPEKYRVGETVEGVIEKKEQFGFFVQLAPGVTGLLPKSKIRDAEDPSAVEALNPGDPISLIVEEIQPEARKITLGYGKFSEPSEAPAPRPRSERFERFERGERPARGDRRQGKGDRERSQQQAAPQSFGSFGGGSLSEALQAALAAKTGNK